MTEAATLSASINVNSNGFEGVIGAINAVQNTMQHMAHAMQQSFNAAQQAATQAAQQQVSSAQQQANRVAQIQQDLANREQLIGQQGLQAAVTRRRQEAEAVNRMIRETVQDQVQANAMIQRNDEITQNEITAMHQQAATQQAQIAEQAAAQQMNSARQTVAMYSSIIGGVITSGFALSTKAFGDFEAQLNKTAAVSNATEAELKKLSDQALELGASTKFSASQVAGAQSELGAAGFTATENLASMPGVLSLAAAGGYGLAESAELAAGTLRGFGKDASEAGYVADTLAQIANTSAASMGDIGESMKYVSTVASSSNQSLEEMSVVIAGLADNMIKGSTAGTTIRSALLSLQSPSTDAMKTMAGIKMSIQDAHGQMLPFTQILEQLKVKTKAMTDVQRNATVEHIFGKEAMSGVLALMNTAPEKMEAYRKSMANVEGAAKSMADRMNQGLKPSIEQMFGALETLAIKIGKQLAPYVIMGANALGALFGAVANLPEPVLNIIAVLGSLTGILLTLGGVAAGIQLAWPAISAAFVVMKGAAIAFGQAALAAMIPLLPWIVGLGAAAAVLYAVWHYNLGGIQQVTETVMSSVQEVFGIAVAWVKEVWGSLQPYFEVAWEAVKGIFAFYLGAVDAQLRVAFAAWSYLVEVFTNIFAGDWKGLFDFLGKTASNAFNALSSLFSRAFNYLNSFTSKQLAALGEMFGGLGQIIADPLHADKGMDRIKSGAAKFAANVTDVFKDAFSGVQGVLETVAIRGFQLMDAAEVGVTTGGKKKPGKAPPGKVDPGAAVRAPAKKDKAAKEAQEAAKALAEMQAKLAEESAKQDDEIAKRNLAHQKSFLDRQQAALEYQHRRGLISEREYIQQSQLLKQELINAETDAARARLVADEAAINKQILIAQSAAAKGVKGEKEKAKVLMAARATLHAQLTTLQQEHEDKSNALREDGDNKLIDADTDRSKRVAQIEAEMLARKDGGLQASLLQSRQYYADLIKEAKRLGMDTGAIVEDQLKAEEQIRRDHYSKILDQWKSIGGTALNALGKIADEAATPFQRIEAASMFMAEAFKGQIAEAIVPAIQKMATELMTKGVPAVMSMAGSYITMGISALTAGAQAAAGWVLMMGPIAWVAAAIVGAIALIAIFFKSQNDAIERQKKLQEELDKINVGTIKNKEDRAKASTDIALKELEREMEEKRKAGATENEINKLSAAKRAVIYQQLNDEMADIQHARFKAGLEAEEASAEASGDIVRALEIRKTKDIADLREDLRKKTQDGDLSEEQAAKALADGVLLIEQKFNADSVAEREAAMQKRAAQHEAQLAAAEESTRASLERQKAAGEISEQLYLERISALDKAASDRQTQTAINEAQFYADQLNRANLSDAERLSLQGKYNSAVEKAQTSHHSALKKQIDDYAAQVSSKYKKIGDDLEDRKRALEAERDAESKIHLDRMDDLEAEQKARQQELDIIERKIDAIKRSQEQSKKEYAKVDKSDFEAQLANVTLDADEKSYEAIEAQLKSAENRLKLEDITQQEFYALATEAALKKAKLAETEVKDDKVTFIERTRIQGTLAEAYEAFQKAQIGLIEEKDRAELESLDNQQFAKQEQVRILGEQKVEVESHLLAIDEKYRVHFRSLDEKLKANKTAWDTAQRDIERGLDNHVQALINSYAPLEARLNYLLYMQSRVGSGGGSGVVTIQGASGTVSGTATGGHNLIRPMATGGRVVGGIKGRDSVPALLMPDEEVLDVSLSEKLRSFLSMFGSNLASVPSIGAGQIVQDNRRYTITMPGLVVDNDERQQALVEHVKREIARDI